MQLRVRAPRMKHCVTQGAADRERTRAVIAELFSLAGRATAALLEDPSAAARAAALVLALAAAALAARVCARVAAEAAEQRFARPALVRETSRSASALAEAAAWLLPGLAATRRALTRRRRRRQLSGGGDGVGGDGADVGDGAGGGGGGNELEGIMLDAEMEGRVCELVEGVRAARARGAPLRHVLLHGAPGTGELGHHRRADTPAAQYACSTRCTACHSVL
jgi:Domain of unknown function (DUF3523)